MILRHFGIGRIVRVEMVHQASDHFFELLRALVKFSSLNAHDQILQTERVDG